jgi:hypothetical protein
MRYVTYWSNDGSSVQGSEPIASVPMSVQRGLYSVNLGDMGLPNMTPIPASAFASGEVRLRVWFSDGVHGFQQVVPDQPLASVPFARLAEKVVEGGVTGLQVEDGSLGLADLNLTNLDTHYLPKSGGTMTGRLVVDNLISANRGIETSGILPDGFLFTVNARGSIWMILDADNPGVSSFRVTDASTRSLFEVDDVGNAKLLRDLSVGGRRGVGVASLDADAAVQFNLPAAGPSQHLKLKSPTATAGFGMRFVNPGMTFGMGLNLLGTSDQRFVLSPEASGKGLVIAPNGNVGIDSVNSPLPFAALTVNGSIGFTSVSAPAMYVYASGSGNSQKPLIMHSPAFPHFGLYYVDAGDRFEMKSTANDTTPSLVVDLDSNWVSIGSVDRKPGYELSVKGEIVCQDLLIENPPTWADHVFEEGYPLKPLEEVETHIREKKHLPGVPSAAEVSRDGILLGEMQSKLLEKIEELTLHLIEQNKRLRAQDERIRELESRLGERAPAAR